MGIVSGLVLVCVLVFLCFAYCVLKTYRRYGKYPGPRFHWQPFNSVTLMLADKTKGLQKMQEISKKYGPVFHANVLGSNWMIVGDYSTIKGILYNRNTFPNESKFREALVKNMGQSMFASEGELWEEKHSILLPLLNKKMMDHSMQVVNKKAKQLIAAIEMELATTESEGSVEVVSLMQRFTLDVIGEMAFGVDFAALTPNQVTFDGQTFSDLASSQIKALNFRALTPKFFWKLPLPLFRKEKKSGDILKGMFDGLLRQTKQQLDEGEDCRNLPALLLKAREQNPNVAKNVYPVEHMLGESFSVWGAGHDTTTYTCAHVLKLVSMYPEVQNKLREEIMESVEKGQNLANYEHCNYLSAVIKEAQRLYPIAVFFLREAVEDAEVNGFRFPKGCTALLNIYSVHMDEQLFDEPEQFKPERWLLNDNLPFLTFGMGKRSCFGKKLALLEIKAMLYEILQNYELLDNSNTHPHLTELNFGYVPKGKRLILALRKLN